MPETRTRLPVVDMSTLDGTPSGGEAFRAALRSATHEFGFFYLVGHGIDRETREALFTTARDFFALHTLTATHATRLVLDRMDESDRPAAVAALAVAVTAAWVVVGAPAFAPMPEAGAGGGTDVAAADVPSWERIAAEAVADDDEHVIKVVYSCREEARARGDERYRTTAAAAVPGASAADP